MDHILTLTLNPALDFAASTPEVVAGPKLRCENATLDPGGGGVNVARAVHLLGGRAVAFVATGGVTGRMLMDLIANEGVEALAFETPGLTRQAFAVTETATGAQYRFVLPGEPWTQALIEALPGQLSPLIGKGDIVVASGSLPPGTPHDLFNSLNALVRDKGARMILDTSGAALHAAAGAEGAQFFCLRLDGAETAQLAGRAVTSLKDAADIAAGVVARGVAQHVVLSHGAEGTILVSGEQRLCCRPPPVPVVSAVGAGDSMVGAIALALARGDSFARALAFGTAAAAAAVTTPATRLCDPVLAISLAEGITAEPI